jgi:hypothetical protein
MARSARPGRLDRVGQALIVDGQAGAVRDQRGTRLGVEFVAQFLRRGCHEAM